MRTLDHYGGMDDHYCDGNTDLGLYFGCCTELVKVVLSDDDIWSWCCHDGDCSGIGPYSDYNLIAFD